MVQSIVNSDSERRQHFRKTTVKRSRGHLILLSAVCTCTIMYMQSIGAYVLHTLMIGIGNTVLASTDIRLRGAGLLSWNTIDTCIQKGISALSSSLQCDDTARLYPSSLSSSCLPRIAHARHDVTESSTMDVGAGNDGVPARR